MQLGMDVKAWQPLCVVEIVRKAEISQAWNEAVANERREQNVLVVDVQMDYALLVYEGQSPSDASVDLQRF